MPLILNNTLIGVHPDTGGSPGRGPLDTHLASSTIETRRDNYIMRVHIGVSVGGGVSLSLSLNMTAIRITSA